ncbi:xanthine dehydrogenase family protein molybdopterin-binding subunit [Streptomyces sp. HNM0574]|uniref:xanthine dehydrogenase family protein molybdopterin-binding subunit n=1 Tax=Streptomyces sp. HNM0574 TaxID=2714954 RepID=UPI00146E1113|nr:xanthine dehydrogenase family protein molybdopterin-binding subunit [Streptomyces sp. HNM0574]NLU70999.1 xanthine dehydrogenase family protein molybdopterin-binding subunit [Streptomyces sp. HNM0574]
MTDSNGRVEARECGTSRLRLEGREKVTGTAPYAYEHPVDDALYACALQADVARGRILEVRTGEAEAAPGVVAVLTHRNAARLPDEDGAGDAELAVLQSDRVHFRGQLVGAVLAGTPEEARHAASLVSFTYEQLPHDARFGPDRQDLYAPGKVNPAFPTDTEEGDPDAALASAAVRHEATYTTPMEHNNPMEPHTCIALWETREGRPEVTLHDSTQGAHPVRGTLAPLFGVDPERFRVIAPHVGGGFGSKGMPHAHNVLALLAARLVPGRPVKLALTRQQMFSLTGHRTPTVQRVRLAADADGRLTAVVHEAVEQTSRIKEFAEQTTVATRMMYAAPSRRTRHRLAALDVPVPSWMRAPGEAPGMFATEVAMDELAHACGLDPVELRVRNEPETDPDSGRPWSARDLVRCLRTGARRFGWERRREPGTRGEGEWLVGLGVASATYPAYGGPGSVAEVEHLGDGRYAVRIGAADIGTGAWTVLTQIAADALGCPARDIACSIGDTRLPYATVAGGSSGTQGWGTAVVAAARRLREEHGEAPPPGARTRSDGRSRPNEKGYAVHSFGAQFAEVRVHTLTGEVRVPRMLGVFSTGRVINPLTARSQFIGGMVMGLSMALFEESVLDPRTGHVVNQDFAGYHVASCADVAGIDAEWLGEDDPHAGPLGAKGIGEIGIVGSPAAVANAVFNATGVRLRDLPLTPEKVLEGMAGRG